MIKKLGNMVGHVVKMQPYDCRERYRTVWLLQKPVEAELRAL